MRRLASIAPAVLSSMLVVLTLLSVALVPTGITTADERTEDLSIPAWEALWTRVLARSVDDRGRIDFSALVRDHADLDRVVAFVGAVDPLSHPERFPNRASRLAFYINAYNALAMHGVVEEGVPENLGGLTKFSFFYLRRSIVGGKSISLYKLENDVIRPMDEEQVHFALNCMVVSCPRLPNTAFTADALEHQLDAAARAFVAEKRNVRVDPVKRELWLSAIFDFYPGDFLKHAPSLIAYVNRYRTEPVPDGFTVRFFDYDWTVNDRGRIGVEPRT